MQRTSKNFAKIKATQFLRDSQSQIRSYVYQFKATDLRADSVRDEIISALFFEIEVYIKLLSESFYPAIVNRLNKVYKDWIHSILSEYQNMKKIFSALHRMSALHIEFDGFFSELMLVLEKNLQLETTQIFPIIEEELKEVEQIQLGRELEQFYYSLLRCSDHSLLSAQNIA